MEANPMTSVKQTRPKRPSRNDGVAATLQPTRKPTVTELLDSWEPLSDEDAMPEIEDFPPEPFDL
jgi:hypothetical protein